MHATVNVSYWHDLVERRETAIPWTRAAQTERLRQARLRARLARLAWPATLAGLTGGFAAVVALRLAGM